MPDFSRQGRFGLVSPGQPGLSPPAEDLRFGQERLEVVVPVITDFRSGREEPLANAPGSPEVRDGEKSAFVAPQDRAGAACFGAPGDQFGDFGRVAPRRQRLVRVRQREEGLEQFAGRRAAPPSLVQIVQPLSAVRGDSRQRFIRQGAAGFVEVKDRFCQLMGGKGSCLATIGFVFARVQHDAQGRGERLGMIER